ncbi:MAG: helix-turn-helix transcriptional regulator [Chloroflexi bacterium]|nr:helix-turn-helix transcriptional regulator [Chloroflexota bacterium]
MNRQLTLEQVRAKFMREPEFREEWERQRPQREFSSALIRARLNAGISQSELARRVGVSRPVIARLEAGLRIPRVDTIMRLASALGVDFTISAVDTVRAEPHEAA